MNKGNLYLSASNYNYLSKFEIKGIEKLTKRTTKKIFSELLEKKILTPVERDYYMHKNNQYSMFEKDAYNLWKGAIKKRHNGYMPYIQKDYKSFCHASKNILLFARERDSINKRNNYLKDKAETANNTDYNAYKVWQKIIGLRNMNYTKLFTIFLNKYEFMKKNYNGKNYKELLFNSANHIKNILGKYGLEIKHEIASSLLASFYRTIDNKKYKDLEKDSNPQNNLVNNEIPSNIKDGEDIIKFEEDINEDGEDINKDGEDINKDGEDINKDGEDINKDGEDREYFSDIARNYSIDEEGNILPPYGYHFKV